MIKLLKVFLFILYLSFQSCSENPSEVKNKTYNWTKVESGISHALYDIDFADEQNGWVVGDCSIILHSADGGESWRQQICPIEDLLVAVDFVDNMNGWICSMNFILNTINSGENWGIKYSADLEEGYFRDIQFVNENIGFVVGGIGSFGSIGVLLKTEDGGVTWHQAYTNMLPTLTHISIVDKQNIWVCGFGGTILSTTDLGLTWTKITLDISPSPSLTTIQFVDQNNGWVGSRDDWLGFYRTTDGGDTWVQRSGESLSIFGVQSFYFINVLHGWLSTFPGRGYTIAKSIDGGQNWEFQPDMGISRINSFCFLSKEIGWAVGLDGVILIFSGS